jgi:hypothetical protein
MVHPMLLLLLPPRQLPPKIIAKFLQKQFILCLFFLGFCFLLRTLNFFFRCYFRALLLTIERLFSFLCCIFCLTKKISIEFMLHCCTYPAHAYSFVLRQKVSHAIHILFFYNTSLKTLLKKLTQKVNI